jgi:hypothetical protein
MLLVKLCIQIIDTIPTTHNFDWLIVLPVKAPAYVVLPTARNRMTVREMWTMFKP